MSRFVSWFATKNGKIFTHTCVGITAFSIFGTQLALHGPMQHKFKEMCQVYKNGKEKPLSPKVQELANIVLKDSTLSDKEREKIKFFNVIGEDLFHIGGRNFPWGALIGIPFFYEDEKNINFGQLRLEGRDSIDWIVEGHDLLIALTLSDKAKKFGLMRELYSCDVWSILDSAAIVTGCFLLPAEVARRVNLKRNALNTTSFRGRISFYMLCYMLGFVLYKCLRDPLQHLSSNTNDRLAAATGRDYLEGGIEFYEKALLKNKALRELLGKRGERMFNKDGSENYILFAPILPVRKRLLLLQEMEKELQMVTV